MITEDINCLVVFFQMTSSSKNIIPLNAFMISRVEKKDHFGVYLLSHRLDIVIPDPLVSLRQVRSCWSPPLRPSFLRVRGKVPLVQE